MHRLAFRAILPALAVCLCVNLTACAPSGQTVQTGAVNGAVERTLALDSFAMTLDMRLAVTLAGTVTEAPMHYDVLADGMQSDRPRAAGTFTSEMMGQTITSQLYNDRDYVYIDTGDNKIKAPYDSDRGRMADLTATAGQLVKALPQEMTGSMQTADEADGGTTYTLTLTDGTFADVFSDLSRSLIRSVAGTVLSDDAVKFRDARLQITLLPTGYVGRYALTFAMDMTVGSGDGAQTLAVQVEVTAAYTDPGTAVTVTPPEDLDAYTLIE